MSRLAAVTGGTGFLGRHVTAALAAAGWRLRLLTRGGGQLPARVSGGPGSAEAVLGSLSDRGALEALVDGADAVVHLAGLVRARGRAAFMAANRDGTAALAAAWRARAPGARFVALSSMAAREPAISDYAASKAAGEAELHGPGDHGPGDVVVLRPSAVYGPGDRATLGLFRAAGWPVQPMLNGPVARVALIHAADVAEAVLAAAEGRLPCGTWELTDARRDGYSWAEIVAAAARAGGRAARPVRVPAAALRLAALGGEAARLAGAAPMLGVGKAREILHRDWGSRAEAQPPATAWRPTRDIASGFAETIAWYQEAGWLAPTSRSWLRTAA